LVSYRLVFSPLRKFPGPFAARISNLWFSSQLGKHDAHKKILALHDKHGDFLRIGSSDLSIVHPKAVQAIYGFGSKCTKADWYDLTFPMVSMQTTRDRKLHDQRRRIWSAAFSDKALRGYEERIKPYQDQLVSQLVAFGERPVNITKWFNLYSWDVMVSHSSTISEVIFLFFTDFREADRSMKGDLAYSMSFHMLEKSEEHWAIKLLNEGMEPMARMFPTWFFRVLTSIPFITRGWWKFIGYCCEKLDERREV
jgi:tryprostatin B 6-hydroxylase